MNGLFTRLKIIVAAFVWAMVLLAFDNPIALAISDEGGVIRGDLNYDGVLSVDDLPLFLSAVERKSRFLYTNKHISAEQLVALTDFNNNSTVDRNDLSLFGAALLDQKIAGGADAADSRYRSLSPNELGVLLLGVINPNVILNKYPVLTRRDMVYVKKLVKAGRLSEALFKFKPVLRDLKSASGARDEAEAKTEVDQTDVQPDARPSDSKSSSRSGGRKVFRVGSSGGGGGGSISGSSGGSSGVSGGGGGGGSLGSLGSGGATPGNNIEIDSGRGATSSDLGSTSSSSGGGSVVEFETSAGIFGSIAGNVIVVGGVDMITWDNNDSVQVIYGEQTLDRLVVAATRSASSSELIPFIGGFNNIAIPEHLREVENGYVLLRMSPGLVTLKLWSRANDPANPNRTIVDWVPEVTLSSEPAATFD